ncbi:MAG: hypothetical protein K2P51_03050 [Rhabdochlamydiaceae bacterium]|nr:hypothetical protein [Rhabdochlamydiaceae bacterium]
MSAGALSSLLNQNEISRLQSDSKNVISSFLKDSDPGVFKKSGDLIVLAYQASHAIRKILKANPHWDNIPKNPCLALENEKNALKKRLLEEANGKRLKDPAVQDKIIYDRIKVINKKIKEYKCSLEKTDFQSAKLVRQWECDKISEIKKRLGAAVQLQRKYYDTTWIGAVAKLFLKLIGRWNNGDTAAIQAALRTLYAWDFEQPLYPKELFASFLQSPLEIHTNEFTKIPYVRIPGIKKSKGIEQIGGLPWLCTSWIKKHLKTDHLYNEPLSRQVSIVNVPAFPRLKHRLVALK